MGGQEFLVIINKRHKAIQIISLFFFSQFLYSCVCDTEIIIVLMYLLEFF